MKKTGILLVTALLVLLLSACGSGNNNANEATTEPSSNTSQGNDTSTDEPKNQEPVKLTMSIWGNDAHKKMYEDMAVQFNELHPNITVDVMVIPFAEYQQKLSIMLASKTAPDIAWLAERMVPQFSETNQLVDISKVKEDADYDFNDIYPSTMKLLTKDGHEYGIPFSTPPSMLFYNKTMFKDKGMETPMELYKQNKWTYEEFQKTAKAMTDKANGVYGVKLFGNWKAWVDTYISFIWGYGGDLFNEDGTELAINSPQSEQAIQMINDMIFKDESTPKPGDVPAFEAGKLAMAGAPLSYVGVAKGIKDFEWDVVPMPVGPADGPILGGFAGYSVLKGTEHEEEAIAFLKFISNKDNVAITAQYFVPPRKSVLESDAYKTIVPLPSEESMQIAVLDQMKRVRTLPVHKNWQNIDNKAQVYFDLLYTQSISVKDMLARLETDINPLLK